jgi:hypothetical protein
MTIDDISPELKKEVVREFFQQNAKKNGDKLYAERGSEYFKAMSARRVRHGRQKLPITSSEE